MLGHEISHTAGWRGGKLAQPLRKTFGHNLLKLKTWYTMTVIVFFGLHPQKCIKNPKGTCTITFTKALSVIVSNWKLPKCRKQELIHSHTMAYHWQ